MELPEGAPGPKIWNDIMRKHFRFKTSINIVGVLNEGVGNEVLEERCGLCSLTRKGRNKICHMQSKIDDFLKDDENIRDYLDIQFPEQDEYQFDEQIFSTLQFKLAEDNRFIKFLYDNDRTVRDIAMTTGYTGALVYMAISAYIRQHCLDKGHMSQKDGKWVINDLQPV
ncbi:hypothetical protein HYU07_03100 [Candidatus Woesearchaeota archaeon]|nr:hypothetical protein [Candidatus Woesearchaeota archaeon]